MPRPHARQRVRLCFDFDTPDDLFDFMVQCRRRGVIEPESAPFYASLGSVDRTAISWEATFLVRLESEREHGWREFKRIARKRNRGVPKPGLNEEAAQLARGESVAESDLEGSGDTAVRRR